MGRTHLDAQSASDSPFTRQVKNCLGLHLSTIIVAAILKTSCGRCSIDPLTLSPAALERMQSVLERSLSYYLDDRQIAETLADLRKLKASGDSGSSQAETTRIDIADEGDICTSRTAALRLGREAGMEYADAIKVATVVSELSRNVLQYAKVGIVSLQLLRSPRPGVKVIVRDQGPGIGNVQQILSGTYRSRTGLGLGLCGSKRIMDHLYVDSAPGKGTVVTGVKYCE
jgi:serine/threonine-protein kinase RsbT